MLALCFILTVSAQSSRETICVPVCLWMLCFVCVCTSLSLHTVVFVCLRANVNNTSKLLFTPRQGATLVAAAGAISDRHDASSFHDISSFRYIQLCIGLSAVHCLQNEKRQNLVSK